MPPFSHTVRVKEAQPAKGGLPPHEKQSMALAELEKADRLPLGPWLISAVHLGYNESFLEFVVLGRTYDLEMLWSSNRTKQNTAHI